MNCDLLNYELCRSGEGIKIDCILLRTYASSPTILRSMFASAKLSVTLLGLFIMMSSRSSIGSQTGSWVWDGYGYDADWQIGRRAQTGGEITVRTNFRIWRGAGWCNGWYISRIDPEKNSLQDSIRVRNGSSYSSYIYNIYYDDLRVAYFPPLWACFGERPKREPKLGIISPNRAAPESFH